MSVSDRNINTRGQDVTYTPPPALLQCHRGIDIDELQIGTLTALPAMALPAATTPDILHFKGPAQ